MSEFPNIDAARSEMKALYLQDDGDPWVVSYSGGKDSTLLLLLVCELLEKHGMRRPLYAIFSDTGIEQDGIVERIEKNFQGLEKLGFKVAIIKPEIEARFFNCIVGTGYGMPYPPKIRWCVDRLKLTPIHKWKRALGVNFIMFTGERFEESAYRKRSMLERLDDNGFYKEFVIRKNKKTGVEKKVKLNEKNERRYCPIRSVPSKELWIYLNKNNLNYLYPWGESKQTLLKQYNANSYLEIIQQNKERRSGCRFCTFSTMRKGATFCSDEEKNFCFEIAKYTEKDVAHRNLITSKRVNTINNSDINKGNNQKILDGKQAIGVLTIEGRKKALEMVRDLESKTGKIWITDEDEAWCRNKWVIDEERIRNGELVDARDYLIGLPKEPSLFDCLE